MRDLDTIADSMKVTHVDQHIISIVNICGCQSHKQLIHIYFCDWLSLIDRFRKKYLTAKKGAKSSCCKVSDGKSISVTDQLKIFEDIKSDQTVQREQEHIYKRHGTLGKYESCIEELF